MLFFGIAKNEFRDLKQFPIGGKVKRTRRPFVIPFSKQVYKDPSNNETMHYLFMNVWVSNSNMLEHHLKKYL